MNCPKCKKGNYHENTGCNVCGHIKSCSQPTCKTNNECPKPCKGEWIDTYLLSKKWGRYNECEGTLKDRYIPGFLIDYCPETDANSKGYQDPCNSNFYYKVINGLLYRVSYKCDGSIDTQTFIKDTRIPLCAIEDAIDDLDKCRFFRESGAYTDINDPSKGYIIDANGQKTLNEGVFLLDNVITDECKVRTVLRTQDIRKAVYPDLGCLGVTYNSVNDTVFVDTGVLVDNETLVSEIPVSGGCKKIRLNYTDSDTIDFSQAPITGFTGEVKFQDTDSVNISKNSNGIKADVNIQDSPTIDLSIDSNGLRADLRACPGLGVEFLDYSNNPIIITADHRGSGQNAIFPDEGSREYNGTQIGRPTPFITNNVNFSFTAPALPAGCDPDFYWLYMVNTQSGSDSSTTDNAIVSLGYQMIFNNSSIFGKTGDVIILTKYNPGLPFNTFYSRDRNQIAQNQIMIPKLTEVYNGGGSGDGFGDSQGRNGSAMFLVAIRPGANISGSFEQSAGFPNNSDYSQVSLPIIGNNVPLNRWFGSSQATFLRLGKIRKSTLPTN